MIRKCLLCKKEFKTIPYYVKKGYGNFCSSKCFASLRLKGKKRPEHSQFMSIFQKKLYKEGKRKPVSLPSETNPAWKGSSATYSAFHHWLNNHKERTYWCSLGNHKIIRKSEFANITGIQDHDINSYIECCTTCHRKFDMGKLNYA